ncbi:MAG: hypothetical protein GY895_19245 [Phycisphaera sp.]|nr:hypothetical protein [Phycisphaera sp.]
MKIRNRCIGAAVLASMIASGATAEVVYDEAIDGELSDFGFAPTYIQFGAGSNDVLFVTDQDGDDRDFFTFTIEAGFQLSGLVLNAFDTDNEFNLAFMSINPGNVLPFDPDSPVTEELLGYTLFDEGDVGSDLFLEMGQAFSTIGFDGPLGPGDYTIWAQETSPAVDTWNLGFIVTPVPAPGALAVLGLAGLAGRRRRD